MYGCMRVCQISMSARWNVCAWEKDKYKYILNILYTEEELLALAENENIRKRTRFVLWIEFEQLDYTQKGTLVERRVRFEFSISRTCRAVRTIATNTDK